MPQTDYTKVVHGGSYQWFFEHSWFNRVQLWSDWDISHNANDELLEKEVEVAVTLFGQYQSNTEFMVTQRDRVGSRLDGNRLAVDANTQLFQEQLFILESEFQPASGLIVELFTEYGDKLDFRNNRLGTGLQLSPEVRWNADIHTQLALRHTYRTLDAAGAEVVTANLTDVRLSYQFSVQSFVRLALIYSDLQQNPMNNLGQVNAHSKALGSQLLYSYKLNPQTLFFAGYSDNAFADDDMTSLTRDQRSVFVKFSYAWML